jgi:hypothetical protein
LLEGVDVVMEAEEKDLSVGVVCTKKDEEPGPCGSAPEMEGDPPVTEKVEGFLLGMEMEGDPPVTEKVEGDALMAVLADVCCKTNDSNSQYSSPINVAAAVNDDQVFPLLSHPKLLPLWSVPDRRTDKFQHPLYPYFFFFTEHAGPYPQAQLYWAGQTMGWMAN